MTKYVELTKDGHQISVKDPRDLPLLNMMEGNSIDSRNDLGFLMSTLFSAEDRIIAGHLSVPDLCEMLNRAFVFYAVGSNISYVFVPEARTFYFNNRWIGKIPIISHSVPVFHVLVSKNVEEL